ncbi:recombinase family protein [Marinobacter koreensis]|uniref:Recombinase family protein n=1 Tax=Marinobacter koreensis TaxID=335974 RepID=A0ABW0RV01_9GAMM|nr:recombinase family protein [Marinobacter koreensis]MCK7549038.1 recombinase family protein [Marinobacter koreensis]
MKPKAYPYFRFSTQIQEMGDSERRQQDKAKKFACEHGLDYDDSLKLHDRAVSGFKGLNFETGKLSYFMKLVDEGSIEQGSYLIIENFDRFSRMEPRKALSPFLTLVDKGIKIAVIDNNEIHSDQSGFVQLMATILYMERAHDESRSKSKKVTAAKQNAKEQLLSGNRKTLWKWGTPKWLDIANDNEGVDGTGYKINHERTKTIKKILEWVIEGRGTGYIIDKLKEQNIQPWGSSSGIKLDKKKPKQWYNSQITRIVNNRALIGERELLVKDSDGKNKRIEIIPNHFPAIVSEEYFEKVQAARRSRDLNRDKNGKLKAGAIMRGGGRKGRTFTNLFQKLAVCGYSIEGNVSKHKCPDNNRFMVYANKDRKFSGGKVHKLRYLQCSASRESGSQCKDCRKLYRYEDMETAFFTHIKDVSVATIFGDDKQDKSKAQEINTKIEELKIQLLDAERQVEKFERAMEEYDGISTTLLKQLKKYETKLENIPNEIKNLYSERKLLKARKEQGKEIHHTLIDLIGALNGCENDTQLYELRLKISNILKSLIDRIEVYNRGNFSSDSATEQKLKNLRESAGGHLSDEELIEMESAIRKSIKQQASKPEIPYFVVRYVSGESRLVMHHPEDPRSLVMNVKWDNEGLTEAPFYDSTMLKLYERGIKSKDGDWRNGTTLSD